MALSKKNLIQDLIRVAQYLGETPSYDDYSTHGKYSPRTIENKFDSWNNGLEAAGLDKNQRINISDQELLEDIDRVADIVGTAPTLEDYAEYGRYGRKTISNRFEGWNEAVKIAGYTPQKLDDIPKEDLLDDLERVAKIVGSAPSEREYNELGKYHWRTYANRFGYWSDAHREIGREPNTGGLLPIDHPSSTRSSDQAMLDELRRLADEDERGLTKEKIKEAKHSASTYTRRFGGLWAANVRAGLKPSHPKPLSIDAFREYHRTAITLSPEDAVVALLPQFTGMAPSVISDFSKDWEEERTDKRVITVPPRYTDTDLSWMFHIPDVWIDTNQSEIDTQLPDLLDWYWQFYDKIHLGEEGIAEKIKRTARDAGLDRYRGTIEHNSIGEVANIWTEDLAFTYGVQLARQKISAENIAQRLGISYRAERFNLRNIFVWCEEKDSEFSHPDWCK